jgi:ComF family protein
VARAIASFKYGGAQRLGRRLAAAMLPRVPDTDVSLVVPVPLHVRRLRHRGFNQSAVLARHLGRSLGCRVALTLAARMRDTPSQITLNPLARATNVAGAFAVRHPELVRDRTILVVDDVWTSGATARALAAVLRVAGATAVDVLTVARVL